MKVLYLSEQVSLKSATQPCLLLDFKLTWLAIFLLSNMIPLVRAYEQEDGEVDSVPFIA